jgi:SAM-dependent methyltransferase
MLTIVNVEQAKAWDGTEGEHWAKHADRYERCGWRTWQRFLDADLVRSDDDIVDVGCGTGKQARDLARIASSGTVLGVDLSAQMLDRARAVSAAEGLTNISFVQADAQVHPFDESSVDLAFSNFGAMFFNDPVAAFTNIGRALRPGGRLALLAWRDLDSNEWLNVFRGALAAGRQLPVPPVGAPTPFGLADQDHVRGVLDKAGFGEVGFESIDEPIEFGTDFEDAWGFIQGVGIVEGLTQDLDEPTKADALAKLRVAVDEHETDEGVLMGTSAWLITARRP